MNAMEKFGQSLKMKEKAMIERRLGMGFSAMDDSNETDLSIGLLVVAKQRQEPGYTWEHAEDLNALEFAQELEQAVGALGFEDDEEDEEANLKAE